MDPLSLYALFITLGLILFGMELFLPGGILGAIGGILLVVAVALGFKTFGAEGGMISAVLILIGVCVYLALVLRFLPQSFVGRRLTLTNTMGGSRSSHRVEDDLVGQTGVAGTDLRPSGIVTFGDRRVDVIADSAWVEKGSTVKVIRVEGNRITVRKFES